VSEDWFDELERKVMHFFETATDEEINQVILDIKKNKNNCEPKSCHGQCQGLGDCDLAKKFRGEIE